MVHNYSRSEFFKTSLQWAGVAVAAVVAGLVLNTLRAEGVPIEKSYTVAVAVLCAFGISSWLLIAKRFSEDYQPSLILTWDTPEPLPLAAVVGLVVVLSLPLPQVKLPPTTGPDFVVTISGQGLQCNAEEPTLTCS
jgi:hypothetical protein